MAYAEQLKTSWRACWYVPGRKSAVKKSGFPTEKAAKAYAQEQEVEARRMGPGRSDFPNIRLRQWAEEWYASQDLEPNTMRNYRTILENHVNPRWGDYKLVDLANMDTEIAAWRKQLHGDYAQGTVNRILGCLVTLLGDAMDQRIIHRNPALAKRRRGKVAPKRQERRQRRYEEITDPFGAFLIAERCATLTGRDDDFIMVTAAFYMSLRWSEVIGLETSKITSSYDLTHQLNELGGAGFYWKVPKDGSQRRIDVPPFLLKLLHRQAESAGMVEQSGWCPCTEGLPAEDRALYRHRAGIHLFTGPEGHPHWRHGTFLGRVFHPAARGMYYAGQAQEFPVFLEQPQDWWDEDTPCPPLDVMSHVRTGKGIKRPQEPAACWAPICKGMKPHGLRHSGQALLEQAGVPMVMVRDRMGHSEGTSASATYSHVTPEMREQTRAVLQEAWESALVRRRALGVPSHVGLVRELLESGSHSRSTPDLASHLPEDPGVMVA